MVTHRCVVREPKVYTTGTVQNVVKGPKDVTTVVNYGNGDKGHEGSLGVLPLRKRVRDKDPRPHVSRGLVDLYRRC